MKIVLLTLSAALLVPTAGKSETPFRYVEGKHGKGELRYVKGIPVLTVRGTPEEIGEQVGVLALRSLQPLFERSKEFARAWNIEPVYPVLLKTGSLMTATFPADYRKELDAMAKAAGISRDLLIFGVTFVDVLHLTGCSTLVVEPGRSASGQLLFGRNLDWYPFGDLHQYSIVTVYHPNGKRPFAAIGWPGMIGPPSGMNDAGLSVTHNEIRQAKDNSRKFDPLGVPTLLLMRRILEECSSVGEAQKLMASNRRASMGLLTVCDATMGRAFEFTTKSLVLREPIEGVCGSTNHFRTKELATASPQRLETRENCWRYFVLRNRSREIDKLSLEDVHHLLHAASAGAWTVQTMVFEPASLRLHVAFGKGPTAALPLQTLDLHEWFERQQAKRTKGT
jgi:predicted choloylglycine hydrolase